MSEFYSPRLALFGYGCREQLVELFSSGQYRRPLLVTDAGLVKAGLVTKMTALFDRAEIAYSIYDEVQPNPTVENVHAGYARYVADDCDCIVTFGGGSPQDCGKGIGVLAYAGGGDILDFLTKKRVAEGCVDIIAITTTAGTGSECTRAYVITDEKTQIKHGIRVNEAQSRIAVNDWELMMELPASITAGTGMDALTHAVESIIGKSSYLLTERLALSAIELVFSYLPTAVFEPSNEKARESMSTAQYMAGLAFGNSGVGLVHSMSHQLSAIYHLPHGLANAILLPHVLSYDREISKVGLSKIGRVIAPVRTHGKDEQYCADLAIESIFKLSASVGTNQPLHELGVKEEDIPLLAKKTLEDGSLWNSPHIPTAEEIEELFRKAI